jgi:hypothetical protein
MSFNVFGLGPLYSRVHSGRERRDIQLVQTNCRRLSDIERVISGMGRNGHQQLAMFQIFVAEAVIFGTEKQRDLAFLRGANNFRRGFPRSLAVAPIKPRTTSGADDQSAVGNRRADRLVTFRFRQNISTMHGHRARPETSRARFPDDRKLLSAEIFHSARHRADVAGAARANHHNADIAQHTVNHWHVWNDFRALNGSVLPFQSFKKFKTFQS